MVIVTDVLVSPTHTTAGDLNTTYAMKMYIAKIDPGLPKFYLLLYLSDLANIAQTWNMAQTQNLCQIIGKEEATVCPTKVAQ